MTTVASHLRAVHEQAARRSSNMADALAKTRGRFKRSAESHRALHRATGTAESGHSQLAADFDGMSEDLAELEKLFREDSDFHRGAMADVEKSAAASDLSKAAHNRDEDELNKLVPSRVQGINRGANALVPRVGTPVARTGTDNAPVAPQLAKIVAMDD